ncbi:sulfotransferase family protein [Ponticoccus sp. (in: a-proteobacteria)]|uniref:sulfotransferase family protein n=1 Tax=Ponticoccus sp. (in: a-proteobacteria) TaxID=1925025 RepID=UPI003AB1389E
MVRKPLDFFLIGAQKSGTTALFAKLTAHPGIVALPQKELHVFDRPDPDPARFDRAFAGADPALLWGEATPAYLYWPGAVEALARYNPGARILVILRDPAERALSHWKMQRARGIEPLSFEAAISAVGRARVRDGGDREKRLYSYVERGFYADQIARLLRHFPRDQIAFCRTEDLLRDEAGLLARLFGFLGVEAGLRVETEKMIRPNDNAAVQVEAGAALAGLTALYGQDIRRTGALTGMALEAWLAGPRQASG